MTTDHLTAAAFAAILKHLFQAQSLLVVECHVEGAANQLQQALDIIDAARARDRKARAEK